uniref:Uncharacterized protein n=1 Tax=Oryza glaberrima TaxID=4538 RepID=I1P8S0_ORYGL
MEDNGAQVEEVVDSGESETMEGVASIALLPSGAISGHFIRLPDSVCYGLHGTPISCERECSRGEDYRLIKLSIIDFKNKHEKVVVVECRGHDAARLQNIDHLHGWEDDIVGLVEKKHGNRKFSLSFECETLKADKAAEEHISKYMPNLKGLDAVGYHLSYPVATYLGYPPPTGTAGYYYGGISTFGPGGTGVFYPGAWVAV